MSIISIGIEYLGIMNPKEIEGIYSASADNEIWHKEQEEIKLQKKEWDNRYRVPIGKTKKEYTEIKNETQAIIDRYKKDFQNPKHNEITKAFIESCKEPWVEKKKRLNKILLMPKKFTQNNNNLATAKTHPIDQLIDFNSAGFAACLWHNESTPSMKYYKNSNSVYCFSCHSKHDAVDVYSILHGVTTAQAISQLVN